MIDRHGPVVASDIPVELSVVLKESRAIEHPVGDLDGPRCVHRVWNVDLQIAGMVGDGRVVLKFAAAAVSDIDDLEEEFVIRPVRSGIFNRNRTKNSVPLADEGHVYPLADRGGTVAFDGDIVLKVRDAPRFRLCGADESAGEQREKKNLRWDFQLQNSPTTKLHNRFRT